MIRRRRRTREIPFSFDSFLDIVANVVGIIIRLILVVWIGARSYSSIQHMARTPAKSAAPAEPQLPADPLQQQLAEAIRALEELPPPRKTLHYRTPVSRPLQAEELLFECNHGRVSFIDIGALLQEARQKMEEHGKLLRTQWQVQDITSAAGAF